MYQGFAENKPGRGSFHIYSLSCILHQIMLQVRAKKPKINVIITKGTH